MPGSFLEPPPLPAPQVGEVVRFGGVRTIDGVMLGSPSGLGPVLLAHLHSPECPDGHRWNTTDLHRLRDAVRPWGGHVVLIAASQSGSQPTRSWIAVADQWGEIFHSVSCEPLHGFPPVDELARWVRFVAIQCPECEGPEGPWRRRTYVVHDLSRITTCTLEQPKTP